MKNFNYKNLYAIQGDKLVIENGANENAELTVSEVRSGHGHGDNRESFTVTLVGVKETQLPQGTYQVTHDSFDPVSLFMSPNSETEYEIVINRELS